MQSKFQEKRMYPAICAECGNECEVPFQPTPGKPIYCRSCFRKGDSTGSKKSEQFKEQFKTLNSKLDTIIRLLNSMVPTEETRVLPVTSKTAVPQPPKVTIIKQTKRKTSPKKTVKKKVVAKKTVTKKGAKKATAPKKKAKKTASPKKTVKKKAAAKKAVAKKATRKKKS
jgi:CxxC-x17-CxxC domain-containing protein